MGEPVVASKEYFVEQQAWEVVVVRVSASEAEFTSRLSSFEGEILGESGLPNARMLPLYHYLAEAAEPRQIDIDVTATQVTDRTEFELKLIRLNVRDNRSANLARAYRLLSVGLERLEDGSVPAWTVKIQTLLQAAGMFGDMGMEEMGLWGRGYAAHLALHRLRDYQAALDWADQILAVPQIDRYPEIAFAATKIRSASLAGSTRPGDGDPLDSAFQQAIGKTIERARALGFRYEEALALEAGAVDLKENGLATPALQRLKEALDIAEAINSPDLAADIREHIVEIHEEFGDIQATGDVLQDIETHLVASGESEQLAINLLRQGRLLLDSHRYPEAIAILSRASELEQSSLTRIETELALASALNEAGRGEEALVHYYRAVIEPASGDFRRPSQVLDIDSALDAMAAIHRQQGEFERAAEIRSTQQQYLRGPEERARWAYGRALDALKQWGAASQTARDRFEAAYRVGEGAGMHWSNLSLLRLCALPHELEGTDPRCQISSLGSVFESTHRNGTERQAAEAAMTWSQLLGLRGDRELALKVAESQVNALLRSGRRALGAWYWQRREPLIDNYIQLSVRRDGGPDGDATGSLLALVRARLLDGGEGQAATSPEPAQLRVYLQSLPADSVLLSYYLGGNSGHAWLGSRTGVRRVPLGSPAEIRARLGALRDLIQGRSWQGFEQLASALGRGLLDPVSDTLAGTVFLVADGPLLGVPVHALAVGGLPLAAGHDVVQVDLFPAPPDPSRRLQIQAVGQVFLAGDPRDWSGDYATRLVSSGELSAVTEVFLGPGLHTVQGVALLLDEFADPRYGEADLVHLAVPGIADLSPKRTSSLFLSEAERGAGRQRMDSAAIGGMPLRAGLVFFSRFEYLGQGTVLQNRAGLLSAALDAGAGMVMASLWETDPAQRAAFVGEFYARLAESGNAGRALSETRRSRLAGSSTQDWAAYFLTTR